MIFKNLNKLDQDFLLTELEFHLIICRPPLRKSISVNMFDLIVFCRVRISVVCLYSVCSVVLTTPFHYVTFQLLKFRIYCFGLYGKLKRYSIRVIILSRLVCHVFLNLPHGFVSIRVLYLFSILFLELNYLDYVKRLQLLDLVVLAKISDLWNRLFILNLFKFLWTRIEVDFMFVIHGWVHSKHNF